MGKQHYSKPSIEKVVRFKGSTRGLWAGRFRDIFGGRAIITVPIHY